MSDSPRGSRRLSLLKSRSTLKGLMHVLSMPVQSSAAEDTQATSPVPSPKESSANILEVLTPQELAKLQDQFKNIDSTGKKNGQISFKEFTVGLQHLGVLANEDSQAEEGLAHVLFNAFDFNNSGTIDYNEFLLAMAVLMKGNTKQKIQFAFSMIDSNNNGQITLDELKKMIHAMFNILAQVMNLSMLNVDPEKYAEVLFERMDADQNGEVTLAEYEKFALKRANRTLLRSLGLWSQETTDEEEEEDEDDIDSGNTSGTTMIGFGSARWKLVLELQIAIRIACQMIAFKPNVNIEDFSVVVQFKVPKPNRSPSADTLFTDYAPLVFRHIRKLCNISEMDYSLSMGPEQIMSNLLLGNLASFGEKVSDGRSGSFFFYSFDERFMVKTIPQHEFETLTKILPDYYEHLKKYGEKSLLMRILGCHQLGSIYFVVLGNVFDKREELSVIYDLKGSTIGRSNPNGFVKKDKDLKHNLHFGDKRAVILDQLIFDVNFLRDHELLDYSLLVGIHDKTTCKYKTIKKNRDACVKRIECSHNENRVYYIGVIDLLTGYSDKKRLELLSKSIIHVANQKGLSVQPPPQYAQRFIEAMEKIILK